jgi:hypothetical protein
MHLFDVPKNVTKSINHVKNNVCVPMVFAFARKEKIGVMPDRFDIPMVKSAPQYQRIV